MAVRKSMGSCWTGASSCSSERTDTPESKSSSTKIFLRHTGISHESMSLSLLFESQLARGPLDVGHPECIHLQEKTKKVVASHIKSLAK